MTKFYKFLGFSLLTLILFCLDRIIKYFFIKNPTKFFGGDFFYDYLNFHFEKNFGIAFSLPFYLPILLIITFGIIVFLIYLIFKAYQEDDWLVIIPLLLIISGASSNLIDRLRFGFVIDYIDVPWFTVFNLADILITGGVALFLILNIFTKKD